MSVEHPYLRGWLPLQDGRNITIAQVVRYRVVEVPVQADAAVHEQLYLEGKLSTGGVLLLIDEPDRQHVASLVGT